MPQISPPQTFLRGYAILSRHLFFMIQNFEQLALARKNRGTLNFFSVLKCVSSLRIFEQLALALKNRVCPEFAVLNIYFYHSKFWTTCDCPGTQSVPWIFYCNEIFFIFQDFWATCACPENRVCPDFFQTRGEAAPPTPASYTTVYRNSCTTKSRNLSARTCYWCFPMAIQRWTPFSV